MSGKQYDERGKGALWLSKWFDEQNTRTPKYTGYVTADRDIKEGERINIAVFFNENKTETDTRPNLNIRVDRRERNTSSGDTRFEPSEKAKAWADKNVRSSMRQPEPQAEEGFSDEIPF